MEWVSYLDEIMNCIFNCLRVLFKQFCSSNSLLLDEINKLCNLKIKLNFRKLVGSRRNRKGTYLDRLVTREVDEFMGGNLIK